MSIGLFQGNKNCSQFSINLWFLSSHTMPRCQSQRLYLEILEPEDASDIWPVITYWYLSSYSYCYYKGNPLVIPSPISHHILHISSNISYSFMFQLGNICKECQCNGHSDVCADGPHGLCKCENHTTSSDPRCNVSWLIEE